MTEDTGDRAAQQTRLEVLRAGLGARLATYRIAAGISQPQLGQALDRTRSMISKVEHGTRRMPAELWRIADDLCAAGGVLITAHTELAHAETSYRTRGRTPRLHPAAGQIEAQTDTHDVEATCGWVPPRHPRDQDAVAWSQKAPVGEQLARELMAVVTRLARSLGRREAIRLVGSVLAAAGLSGLGGDEYTRVAQAVDSPRRVDAHVIDNLVVMLAVCKRQEDKLGPCEILETVMAQHAIVRRLLHAGECPDKFRKPLHLVDSTMACTIGGYLIDTGHPQAASRYFDRARRAAHHAHNPICAAYAAINTSFAAFQIRDTPTALDTAAAARSLAARTNDARLQALAEEQAAGAYALDRQYTPCLRACDRAHDLLAGTSIECAPTDSPAYWVHEGTLSSKTSTFLALLGKPHEAVEAANLAQTRFNRTYIGLYARCQVRLSHALVLDKDITQAARVLGDVASQACLSPRLTTELHTARALMQPWHNTHAVKTLDDQLEACGLTPHRC